MKEHSRFAAAVRQATLPSDTTTIVIGAVAVVALVVEAVLLDRFEWYDAAVALRFDAVRACHPAHLPRLFTGWAPYLAAALITGATIHALLRGVPRANVGWQLALLALALLLVQALKLVLERDRPGAPPWVSGGGSFPSGHAANAAVCTAAALRLLAHDAQSSRITRAVVQGLGVVFVVAVAFTRLYLTRHWLTDVVAGSLLGLGCWGLSAARPTVRGRWITLGVVSAVLFGFYLAAACGGRVHLPSPATLAEGRNFRVPLRQAALRGASGTRWMSRQLPRKRSFLRLEDGQIALRVRTRATKRAILKFVAKPLHPLEGACHTIEVAIDGRTVATQIMQRRWRTYAFALPAIPPGIHELTMRPGLKPGSAWRRAPTFAIQKMSLERHPQGGRVAWRRSSINAAGMERSAEPTGARRGHGGRRDAHGHRTLVPS